MTCNPALNAVTDGVAFVRNTSTREARLHAFDAQTGAAQVFDARYVDGTFTAWLPDGSGILYTAVERGAFTPGNGGQIFLQPYPSGVPRRITSDLQDYLTAHRRASLALRAAGGGLLQWLLDCRSESCGL